MTGCCYTTGGRWELLQIDTNTRRKGILARLRCRDHLTQLESTCSTDSPRNEFCLRAGRSRGSRLSCDEASAQTSAVGPHLSYTVHLTPLQLWTCGYRPVEESFHWLSVAFCTVAHARWSQLSDHQAYIPLATNKSYLEHERLLDAVLSLMRIAHELVAEFHSVFQ